MNWFKDKLGSSINGGEIARGGNFPVLRGHPKAREHAREAAKSHERVAGDGEEGERVQDLSVEPRRAQQEALPSILLCRLERLLPYGTTSTLIYLFVFGLDWLNESPARPILKFSPCKI